MGNKIKKELYKYTESEVKKLCVQLINDYTNLEYLKETKQDFERE
jgi:hypothetical protein